jgi:hypothetical protein
MVEVKPGPIVLFGSGEIAASARAVYADLLRRLPSPCQIAVLETPAGFELNSERVAGRVADYLRQRLEEFHPRVTVIPARKRGTPFSPDDPAIVAPLFEANLIFLGPGSPTYAIRQLRGSLAWQVLMARHRRGAAIVMASAATVAASAQALPVYEIFKVGEDPHWVPGLNFLGALGLRLVLVPHWNNTEGGPDLDTSRCFMGLSRFAQLLQALSPDETLVGIDEYTALLFECGEEYARVMGSGGITVQPVGKPEARYEAGQSFPLALLGACHQPEPTDGVPPEVWEQVLSAERQAAERAASSAPAPTTKVLALLAEREAARRQRDWAGADALRARLQALGWQVNDTPAGPQLIPL